LFHVTICIVHQLDVLLLVAAFVVIIQDVIYWVEICPKGEVELGQESNHHQQVTSDRAAFRIALWSDVVAVFVFLLLHSSFENFDIQSPRQVAEAEKQLEEINEEGVRRVLFQFVQAEANYLDGMCLDHTS
jgi:hypothetical protein